MLFTKIIGSNITQMNPKWEVTVDKWGTTFLRNNSIHQKIRIIDVEPILEEEYINYSMNESAYILDSNVKFTTSNKNLNISLQKENVSVSVLQNYLLFLAIAEPYQLKGFKLSGGNKILHTFSTGGKSYHRGAAICFNEYENDGLIMQVIINDTRTDTTKIYDVKFDSGNILVVPVSSMMVNDYKGFTLKDRFYVSCTPGRIPTAAVLVNSNTEPENVLVEQIAECMRDIKNSAIVPLPGNESFEKSNWTEEEWVAINNALSEALTNNRNRAVTLVGLKHIPAEITRKYRILYVFSLDPNTGVIENIKSN